MAIKEETRKKTADTCCLPSHDLTVIGTKRLKVRIQHWDKEITTNNMMGHIRSQSEDVVVP